MLVTGQGIDYNPNDFVFSGVVAFPVTGNQTYKYDIFLGDSIQQKYDAYLPNRSSLNPVVAAGYRTDEPSADITGTMSIDGSTVIYETMHGREPAAGTFKKFNFYQAFYPAGYFAPPYGETYSLLEANVYGDPYTALFNGGCGKLTNYEYHQINGIVSKTSALSSLVNSENGANVLSPIYAPHEECPPDFAIPFYFDELYYTFAAGTKSGISLNAHNNNPVPTALDFEDIKIIDRYERVIVVDEDTNQKSCVYAVEDGNLVTSYSDENSRTKINTNLCPATLMEPRMEYGRGTVQNPIFTDTPGNYYQAGITDYVTFFTYEPWNLWHFVYRENADHFPFNNNAIQYEWADPTRNTARRGYGEGTLVFDARISSEDWYWANRQCPEVVSNLPWTFGGTVKACPSSYFDIPYYAAIRKFGFYGTRFLHTCNKLDFSYKSSGSQVYDSESPYPAASGSVGCDSIEVDSFNLPSYQKYEALLHTASIEEKYANFFAGNKGFLMWANYDKYSGSAEYASLATNTGFLSEFNTVLSTFSGAFGSLSGLTGAFPKLVMNFNPTQEAGNAQLISSGKFFSFLEDNRIYDNFKNSLFGKVNETELNTLSNLESGYSFFVAESYNVPDQNFYRTIISGKEERIRTRFFENSIRGNAVDLFPHNSITFSFDNPEDYYNQTGWIRRTSVVGKNSELPEIDRQYFEGAYGKRSVVSGVQEKLSQLSRFETNSFYPGYFYSTDCGKTLPETKYVPVTSGTIRRNDGLRLSASGWLALGYNDVGGLDSNFSCYSPIFVQDPVNVFCKVGQSPTLRAYAVDYHTLPEDKINRRYSEIMFWADKLKLTNSEKRNNFPLQYKWGRIRKNVGTGELIKGINAFRSGYYAGVEWADPTGQWCGIEGPNSKTCSIIHPTECIPQYEIGSTSRDGYTFVKGVKMSSGVGAGGITYPPDDEYKYFCLVSGRFGVRVSEPVDLTIEKFVSFDIAYRNGTSYAGLPEISFVGGDGSSIPMEQDADDPQGFDGFQQDGDVVPEDIAEFSRPPSNEGFMDGNAVRFIGPVAYRGETRSYKPPSLTDTRGLRGTNGFMVDYGKLIKYRAELTQSRGDALYGYKHLPTCEDYSMANGKRGVKLVATVGGKEVRHWAVEQKAAIGLSNPPAIPFDKLVHVGDLYPPVRNRGEEPYLGIGHWQFHNNLGLVKRFGRNSDEQSGDYEFIHGRSDASESTALAWVKERVLKSTDLAGENCGYQTNSIGRNMVYFVEAYERFYIICDPIKKKNVKNLSFISPHVRFGNAGMQFFWLGQPSDMYLKREPMYGPYAYHWKVSRHNRDRHGNGMTLGAYSMGAGQEYTLMYDIPAVYGLYLKSRDVKSQARQGWLTEIKRLRLLAMQEAFANYEDASLITQWIQGHLPSDVRGIRWGVAPNDGQSVGRGYGDVRPSCDPEDDRYSEIICTYKSMGQSSNSYIGFEEYYCEPSDLRRGACFDPCQSLRYPQGFWPGGKLLNLIGYEPKDRIIRLVNDARYKDTVYDPASIVTNDDGLRRTTRFRGPAHTPYALEVERDTSVDPCKGGGADHCNYLTATIELGGSCYLVGDENKYNSLRFGLAQQFLA